MAASQIVSGKRLAIVKANARTVGAVGVASFITVFCLIASKAVISQNAYQARVTKAKENAKTQLVQNVSSAEQLIKSYQDFVAKPTNIIGGSTDGSGDNDGDNAKIILDALPSQYDFPALTSSLEKVLDTQNLKGSIAGTDDQLNQQGNSTSVNPQPISMPFTLSANAISYAQIQSLIGKLQSSIRPMQIDTIDMSGATNSMILSITAHTYYQPGKSLSITTKVVK